MSSRWNTIAVPPHKSTPLWITCESEAGRYGRYRLQALSGDQQIASRDYPWNVWQGHCAGQLLIDDFINHAEAEFEKVQAVKRDALEVLDRARALGLQVEGEAILSREIQGYSEAEALVEIDRWLGIREGELRMQIRVLARPSIEEDWECISEGEPSEPLTKEQAFLVVHHWSDLHRILGQRYQRVEGDRAQRVDAFGAAQQRPRG